MGNKLIKLITAFVMIVSFTSCEVIGGIFKAGMGFGIALLVIVLAVVLFAISKLFEKK
jgi:hypothetical protein